MGIDSKTFREAMAHWASGVTVVTTMHDGTPVGITASSFASLSLEPPQILVCVAKKLYTHGAIKEYGSFAVNVLAKEQLEWGMRFAGLIPEVHDRFASIDYQTVVTGCPVLPGVLAWLDCGVRHAYDGGDHTIFVGEVLATAARSEGDPLLYYNRHWRRLDGGVLTLG